MMKPISISLLIIVLLAFKNDDKAIEKVFAVSSGGVLRVSCEKGDIRVVTTDKDEVRVKVLGLEENEADKVEMTQTGNIVFINYSQNGKKTSKKRGGDWDWNWNWNGTQTKPIQFDISIPEKFSIDLESAGGDLTLEGELDGKAELKTSGGDILLGNIKGVCEVKTSGGDIKAGKLFERAELRTAGGDIDVQFIGGDIVVKTSGGDIRLGDVRGRLEAKTSGGNVSVGDVGGFAELGTAGGDIRAGKISGEAILKTSGGDVFVGGASGNVKAKTSGGSLGLESITGSIDASTSGGDIRAELAPVSLGRSSLSSSAGNIKLYLPDNTKAKIDARIRTPYGNLGYSITSDFENGKNKLSDEASENSKEIRATYILNGGGHQVFLETSHGNIDIRKSAAK